MPGPLFPPQTRTRDLDPPQTRYKRGEFQLVSKGCPYFAAVAPISPEFIGIGIPQGPNDWFMNTLTVALEALPTQNSSPDEIHWLASHHTLTPPVEEVFSLGVTPSGKLACKACRNPAILSQTGIVVADSLPHQWQIGVQTHPTVANRYTFRLSLDDSALLTATFLGEPFMLADSNYRYMLFNGADGLSRVPCRIYQWDIGSNKEAQQYPAGPQAWRWPINEGEGEILYDWEHTQIADDGTNEPPYGFMRRDATQYHESSSTQDLWPLQLQRYDPETVGLPRQWGAMPTDSLRTCYAWKRGTSYRSRDPVSPTYHRVLGPGSA